MDMGLDLWTMMVAGLGAVAGAAARAYGERLRSLERRDVSEKDLWLHIGKLEQRVEAQGNELSEARTQIALLQSQNQTLRDQHRDLSDRYDRLRERYDRLLRDYPGTAPPGTDIPALPLEGPSPGPSPVPGGDQP